MELFTQSEITHLPQSVLSIKSKNGLNYSSSSGNNPVIDFEISQSIGYYLAEDVVLSFDFEYSSSDGVVYNLRPQNNMGFGGMINQISIYSLSDGILLEEIQDYNILNSVLMSHNNGSDEEIKDGVFKRLSMTQSYTNDYDSITPFCSPNAHPVEPTSLWGETQAYQSQKIQLPIRLSHLLSNSSVIPVSAIGGLRIRFQLNPPEAFNMLHGYDVDNKVLCDKSEGNIFSLEANQTLSINKYLVIEGFNSSLTLSGGNTSNLVGNEYTASTLADQFTSLLPSLNIQNLTVTAPDADTILFTNNGENDISLEGTSIETLLGTQTPLVIVAGGQSGALNIIPPIVTYGAFEGGGDDLLTFLNAGISQTLGNAELIFKNIGYSQGVYTIEIQNLTQIDLPLIGTLFTSLIDLPNLTIEALQTAQDVPLISAETALSELFLPQINLYLNNPKNLNTCPFKIGQSLLVKVNDLSVVTSSIINMEPATDGIKLTFEENLPDSINSSVEPLVCISNTPLKGTINYNLRNVSLELPVITPPPAYVESLQKAIKSEQGLPMDIKAFQLIRSSVQGGQTLSSLNLPFTASRAKGIISVPNVVETNSFNSRAIANNFDLLRLTKYFYEYKNVKHPERGIDTDKARQGSLSQELMIEQFKSFEYCLGDKFLSLDGYSNLYKNKTFFLGRGLGVFNTTFDTTNSNLNLTLESTSSDGGIQKSLNISHYCSCVNTILMRAEGVILIK